MLKETNSDYVLWKRIKAGEKQAFQDLYNLYADILFSFGTIFSKDHEFVKDCIHDLIVDLYKYRRNLADSYNIRNYLFKSLKRRIQTKATKKLNLVYSEALTRESETLGDHMEQSDADEQQQQLTKITELIDQLPFKQREILNLRFQLDLSYPEIAGILDISTESVRTSVYRSIKTIRERLDAKDMLLLLIYLKSQRDTA